MNFGNFWNLPYYPVFGEYIIFYFVTFVTLRDYFYFKILDLKILDLKILDLKILDLKIDSKVDPSKTKFVILIKIPLQTTNYLDNLPYNQP